MPRPSCRFNGGLCGMDQERGLVICRVDCRGAIRCYCSVEGVEDLSSGGVLLFDRIGPDSAYRYLFQTATFAAERTGSFAGPSGDRSKNTRAGTISADLKGTDQSIYRVSQMVFSPRVSTTCLSCFCGYSNENKERCRPGHFCNRIGTYLHRLPFCLCYNSIRTAVAPYFL